MTRMYMHVQMRVAESTAVLKAIAKGNGTQMPRNRLALPRVTAGPPATVLDTFKVRELRGRMLILMFCWFVASMAYYGVSLALEDLPGSLYRNFFLIAVVEFPSYFCTIAVRAPSLPLVHSMVHSMHSQHAYGDRGRSLQRWLCVCNNLPTTTEHTMVDDCPQLVELIRLCDCINRLT